MGSLGEIICNLLTECKDSQDTDLAGTQVSLNQSTLDLKLNIYFKNQKME